MSETIPSALLAHYQSGSTTIAVGLRAVRSDGQVFRLCSSDKSVTVGGEAYPPGLNAAAVEQSAGLAVNTQRLEILFDAIVTKADALAGYWANARWRVFEFNVFAPEDGVAKVRHYVTGEVEIGELSVVIELRAPTIWLNQEVGAVTQPTCRARFADYPTQVPDARCGLDSAGFIETGAVTSVTSQQVFTDTSRMEADDWFGEGVLNWLTGENAGLSQKVKSFAAGEFTLSLPMPFAISVTDTYEGIAGCRGRRTEDCKDKHDNVLNFQGEPDLPGPDAATSSPTVDV